MVTIHAVVEGGKIANGQTDGDENMKSASRQGMRSQNEGLTYEDEILGKGRSRRYKNMPETHQR